MFEKRSRRIAIAQQLFVRVLQGSYNAFTSKNGFHIPHGEALLFCICCTQIIHALFCRPDTLARSYEIWLSNASGASRRAIEMVRDVNLNGTFDVQDIDKILQRSDLIPANRLPSSQRGHWLPASLQILAYIPRATLSIHG